MEIGVCTKEFDIRWSNQRGHKIVGTGRFRWRSVIGRNGKHSVQRKPSRRNRISSFSGETTFKHLIAELSFSATFSSFYPKQTILELPKKLLYSLRFPNELRVGYGTWSTDTLFYPHIGNSEPGRGQHQNDGDEPSYSREGFSAIQNAIAQAFVRIKNSNQIWPSVFLQRLPIPEQKTSLQNAFLELTHYLIFLILLSFASIYVNAVRVIVSEKEKQLSEMMKIMGLSSTLQWASWFVRTMLSMSISITLIVVLLSVSRTFACQSQLIVVELKLEITSSIASDIHKIKWILFMDSVHGLRRVCYNV